MGDNCAKKMFAPLTTQKPLPAPTIEGLPVMFKLYSLDLTTQGPPDLLESGQLTFDLIGLLLGNIFTLKKRSRSALQVKSLCITRFRFKLNRYKCKRKCILLLYRNLQATAVLLFCKVDWPFTSASDITPKPE